MDPVRNSVVPLYHQIFLLLRQLCLEIADPAVPLPGEFELAERYNVSRITVRKALDQLEKEGMIRRRRGAGTFVTPIAAKAQDGGNPEGLLDNLVNSAQGTTVRVVSLERIAAPPAVAAQLELPKGDYVIKVVRVRSLKGTPVSHLTTFVPESIGAALDVKSLRAKPMLTLLEEHGVKALHMRQSISARLADSEVAERLGITAGAALLAVKRVVLGADDKPIQLMHGLFRPDRYEYRIELGRGGSGVARVWYQKDQVEPD